MQKIKTTTFSIEIELLQQLEQICEILNTNKSNIVNNLIRQYVIDEHTNMIIHLNNIDETSDFTDIIQEYWKKIQATCGCDHTTDADFVKKANIWVHLPTINKVDTATKCKASNLRTELKTLRYKLDKLRGI